VGPNSRQTGAQTRLSHMVPGMKESVAVMAEI
jgi:hypothetical protein